MIRNTPWYERARREKSCLEEVTSSPGSTPRWWSLVRLMITPNAVLKGSALPVARMSVQGSVADVPGARRDVGLVPGIDPNARDAPSTAYYLIEAKKFIQRARHADNPDVTQTDLEMAEWLLPERLRKERTRQPRASQVKLRDARVPEALLHCRPIQPAVQEPTLINSVRRSFRAR